MKPTKLLIVVLAYLLAIVNHSGADEFNKDIYYKIAGSVLSDDLMSRSIAVAKADYLSFILSQDIPEDAKAELLSEFDKISANYGSKEFMLALRQKVADVYRKNFSDVEAAQIFEMLNTPLFKKWKKSQEIIGLIIL